jgi:hypothetical protein
MPKLSDAVNSETFLHAALEGLELQKTRVEEQIAQVRSMLGQRGPKKAAAASHAAVGSPAPKRVLSEAARKRIAAAQKKRWAAYRKQAAEVKAAE